MSTSSEFQFHLRQLKPLRPPGISAFMRIRNGADFLQASIESHLPAFDEIVAVYNACTDRTPEILAELQKKHPSKLRVLHYEPLVYPVGSEGHIRTEATSIHNIANYYNYALANTRFSIATKLDDDHIAFQHPLHRAVASIRDRAYNLDGSMPCFSGLNLCRPISGIGLLRHNVFAGNGDHFFFQVTPRNFFAKDRRFERFNRTGLRRTYMGLLYWHCKFLKHDHGFGNYELSANPDSRYLKQRSRFLAHNEAISLSELKTLVEQQLARTGLLHRALALVSDKHRLRLHRLQQLDFNMLAQQVDDLIGLLQGPSGVRPESILLPSTS